MPFKMGIIVLDIPSQGELDVVRLRHEYIVFRIGNNMRISHSRNQISIDFLTSFKNSIGITISFSSTFSPISNIIDFSRDN